MPTRAPGAGRSTQGFTQKTMPTDLPHIDTLHLRLGGLTLILGEYGSRFADASLPRTKVGARQSISFSANGTPGADGKSYETPHIWQPIALLDAEHYDRLRRLAAKFEASPANILIYDYTDKFYEPTPRSRAIAPDAIAETAGGEVSYFAQFSARFTAPIQIVKEGRFWKANLQLTEIAKVPA